MLHIHQASPVVDVVAQYYKVGLQQRVMLGGSRVGEFEAVRSVVHAYVPDEGLVQVAERGQGRGLLAHGVGAMAQSPTDQCLALGYGRGGGEMCTKERWICRSQGRRGAGW